MQISLIGDISNISPTWAQFYQRSVRKLCAQLFCAYVLGLYFTGARLLAQKLHVEHW
jgi:hypothetical protein